MKPATCFQIVASACVLLAVSFANVSASEPKGLMKPKEVKALVLSATTSGDHEQLARHFAAMAEKHEQEALEHEALAVEYASNTSRYHSKVPNGPDTVSHCKYFAEHCRKAAQEMRAMAAFHEAITKELREAKH